MKTLTTLSLPLLEQARDCLDHIADSPAARPYSSTCHHAEPTRSGDIFSPQAAKHTSMPTPAEMPIFASLLPCIFGTSFNSCVTIAEMSATIPVKVVRSITKPDPSTGVSPVCAMSVTAPMASINNDAMIKTILFIVK